MGDGDSTGSATECKCKNGAALADTFPVWRGRLRGGVPSWARGGAGCVGGAVETEDDGVDGDEANGGCNCACFAVGVYALNESVSTLAASGA